MTYVDEVADYIESVYSGTTVWRNSGPPSLTEDPCVVLSQEVGDPSELCDGRYDHPIMHLRVRGTDVQSTSSYAYLMAAGLQCTRRQGRILSIITARPTYQRFGQQALHEFSVELKITMVRSAMQ